MLTLVLGGDYVGSPTRGSGNVSPSWRTIHPSLSQLRAHAPEVMGVGDEKGIGFGGVVTASLSFDPDAATQAALAETVRVEKGIRGL